jgi:hypothetical protein
MLPAASWVTAVASPLMPVISLKMLWVRFSTLVESRNWDQLPAGSSHGFHLVLFATRSP